MDKENRFLDSVEDDTVKLDKIEAEKTEFYALKDDCIRELLDWLPIKDLFAMSLTCKRFLRLCTEQFGRTHKDIRIKNNCSTFHRLKNLAQTIFIKEQKTIDIQHMDNLKKIVVWTADTYEPIHVTRESIEKLRNVEVAEILCFNKSIYSNVLKSCIKLECLSISLHGFKGYSSLYKEWLQQSYPTVKYLTFYGDRESTGHLKDLLKRCPNLEILSVCTFRDISYMNWLLTTEHNINELVVYISLITLIYQKNVFEHLYKLQENKQIKKLHLLITDRKMCEKPLLRNLKIVESIIYNCTFDYGAKPDKCIEAIISLTSLKTFVYYTEPVTHMKLLATSLVHLEEMHLSLQSNWLDTIMPWVRHSPKIKIICFSRLTRQTEKIEIDLPKVTLQQLHQERQQLKNASNLTIYLPEKLYLHMKSQSMISSYGLVEIKRVTSYISKHPFFVFPAVRDSHTYYTQIE